MNDKNRPDAPLRSTDLVKVLIFSIITIPTVVPYLFGSLVVLFVVFGVRMAKRSGDFSHILVAVTVSKWYLGLLTVALLGFAAASHGDPVIAFAFAAFVAMVYAALLHHLFLVPVRAHRDWVITNGIFASKPSRREQANVSIVRAERDRSHSVADELLKWARLKEEGVVTEAEFELVRQRLLQRL